MRTLIVVVLGIVAGFLAGIVLNEVLAMIGLIFVDDIGQLRVLRLLPAVLAVVGGVAGPMLDARRPHSRSSTSAPSDGSMRCSRPRCCARCSRSHDATPASCVTRSSTSPDRAAEPTRICSRPRSASCS